MDCELCTTGYVYSYCSYRYGLRAASCVLGTASCVLRTVSCVLGTASCVLGLRAVYQGLRAVCDALYLTTIYVVDYGLCVVLCTLLQSGGCGLWGCSVRCLSNEEKYGCGKLAYYAFVTDRCALSPASTQP